MATPASSATSPSPPMPYLQHMPGPQPTLQPDIPDTLDRDQRKKAVDKFLARAEIAMVTRRLRAHLAYASYKATHNIPHASIRQLEARNQSQKASFNRTIAAKRRAVGANSYYNKTVSPGPSGAGTGAQRRGGSNAMAPPASVVSPRPHPSTVTPGHSNHNDVASSQRNPTQAPNLFSSILALPSTKQARTIHNPNEAPVPAPQRSVQYPKSRIIKASPRNDPARPPSKTKRSTNKNAKLVGSPDRRRKKTTSVDKGKKKERSDDMDVDGEMDLQAAAATLTSLLLHHRPSVAGSASSPRSSIDGSEAGSTYSHPHFSQSSTRISSQKAPPAPSSSTLASEVTFRSQTPPPSSSHKRQLSTPRAAPTDNEAANLMLFLATSPSPVRVNSKDSKDAEAYRALTGVSGPLRSKGRVLFPSNPTTDRDASGNEDLPTTAASTFHRASSTLARGGESFSSSISSIGSDMGRSTMVHGSQNTIASGSSASASLSQLLPSAPLPAPNMAVGDKPMTPSPRSGLVGVPNGGNESLGSLDFNFHEFINASPSPSRGLGNGHSTNGTTKSNFGLVADMGRKLFDEEQMRHVHLQAATPAPPIMPLPRQDERTLGTFVDSVHI